MGVVYKLKKEIVDFIINEKKSNPSLGCRNLVNLVAAKFQTKISKSAINGVIKSAQLSSSIGRKPIVIKSHLKVSKNLSFPNALVGNPDVVVTGPPTTNGSPRHEGTKTFGGDSLGISSNLQEPRIVEPSPLREEKVSLKFSQDKGVLCDGAGCFFLKAAQWELFHRPMLGKMISKNVSPELISDADTLMDVLLFLPMFGIRRVEDISSYQGCGLWAIDGLTEGIKPDKFLSLVNGIQDKKDFSLRLSNEIPQIFFEVAYIKIVLEDQTELVLDAQYRNLRSIKEQSVYYSSPIERSLERLTGKIIANGRPVIIKNISTQIIGRQDEYGFSPSVYQLIAAFENIPGKRMVKAAILDEHGEEISKFAAIPVKRRFFIMGANICHSEERSDEALPAGRQESQRGKILRFAQNGEKVLFNEASEFCEESFLVKKNSILTEDLRLRAIFVKKLDSKDQVLGVILTNIPESAQSSSEVISEYLKEWPDFPLSFPNACLPARQASVGNPDVVVTGPPTTNGSPRHEGTKTFGGDSLGISSNFEDSEADKDFYNDTKVSFNHQEVPDLWNNLETILSGFNKYCQRHFFSKDYARMDISLIKERFYQLEGHLKKGSGGLEVNLILPEGYAYRPDLEHAIRKLNEFHIQNYAGQTLFLKIAP